MNGQCCESYCEAPRSFLTKKEKVDMLEEYKKKLEREAQGVAERIKELSSNKE